MLSAYKLEAPAFLRCQSPNSALWLGNTFHIGKALVQLYLYLQPRFSTIFNLQVSQSYFSLVLVVLVTIFKPGV